MDRGAWWATVHGVTELDTTEQLSTAQHVLLQKFGMETKLNIFCKIQAEVLRSFFYFPIFILFIILKNLLEYS